MSEGSREITLRFLAAPTDATFSGAVHAGKILEWIDKAGYACAVGWSGRYCVTAYVGNVHFSQPVLIGQLVEVRAQLIYTGRTSMHIRVSVHAADPTEGRFAQTTQCLVIFVAVDSTGKSTPVPRWEPVIAEDSALEQDAIRRIILRQAIEDAMHGQRYTAATQAREITLRFLAAPTDVNWGGKVHGGIVMRWIDEAAYVCAVGWSGRLSEAVYAGGVRFYQPLLIGHVVEVQARLIYTERTRMHIAVHVRSGDPKDGQMALTTHCLIVFVARDGTGQPIEVPQWQPSTEEDRALEQHAIHLVELRRRVNAAISM
jgi:acyl-CoA hydrolase